MIHNKANPNANDGRPPIILGLDARFVDGRPLSASDGGIVVAPEGIFSIARQDMAPGTPAAELQPDGRWAVPAIRTGRATFLEDGRMQPTTYGAELEGARLNPDGTYGRLSPQELDDVKELYGHMDESGTAPTADQAEFEQRFWDMAHGMVDAATAAGQLAASLSVFGQHDFGPEHANPHSYVGHVTRLMEERTGFNTTATFRTAGAQAHTGVSDTMAAVEAAEALQYLGPILAAPTLAGPLLRGGIANLTHATATPEQRAHMAASSVSASALGRPALSWRYLLRVLGSPSAGVWRRPAADTKEEYLQRANDQLAAGEINNVDRTHGWHADRVRVVLDGKGANTIEDCSADTALGNPEVLVPLLLLRAGLTTALEEMAMRGRDPREVVARVLGTTALSREERLRLAHNTMLHHVSRYGNDAQAYGRKPGGWLPTLLEIARQAPFTKLTPAQTAQLRRSFKTAAETRGAANRWCIDNGADAPTAQTWFDLGGLNNPAVYMLEHYKALVRQGKTPEQAIRAVELSAGQALHHASAQRRDGAPKSLQKAAA
ncbi:MAG TPA: hypothetical protein VLF71_03640 [Candidatus Saccharimonadales bacterium]|nr:hypothetical protein [Candidatus Saccharimonadales bacterium]